MKQRTGLGKGLGALIPSVAQGLQELPISEIVPNPNQPRRQFDVDAIADLAASIRQVGILQPVVVRPSGDRYEIIMGERRWRAAQRAGLASIPAMIMETDDKGSLERALMENIHRRDLNPLEEAAAYKQLIEDAGITHEQLAEKVGISRPQVSNALRLLELPANIQKMVLEGRLSSGHARALLGMAGHPLMERVAQRVISEGLSVRQTEELARSADIPVGPASGVGKQRSTSMAGGLSELSERLSDELQTRVIVTMGKRKGKIVIEFGSTGDLERITKRLGGGESNEEAK